MTQTRRQHRNILKTLLLALAIIAFVLFSLWYKLQQPVIISSGALKAYGAYVFEQPRLTKPFTLLDQNNQQYTKQNLLGKWSLVFFGFSHCPDICPTTLSLLKDLKQALSDTEVADDTQFIMVSVDPARDTAQALKTYVEYFDPDFIGLTGKFLNIYNLATNWNAAFKKVALDGGDYTVDHSGNIVLLNEYGDYQGFLRPPFNVNKIKQVYRSVRATHRR